MRPDFKTNFKRFAKWSLIIFLIMFIFRMSYGYLSSSSEGYDNYSDSFFSSLGDLRKNYASEKIQHTEMTLGSAASQKYEKTATVRSRSTAFEKDEALLKTKTQSFKAVIQYEQNMGQKGFRQTHLLIGVSPALFDSFYVEVQKIGQLRGREVTKVDKTNEYRQLNAKKVSLEKALQSLNELKSKGGQIADFVALNDKILTIEENLQELGVELGNFDSENEFCTVRFSLFEGTPVAPISFIHRVKVALEWTVQYYLLLMLSVFLFTLFVFLIVVILEKLKSMGFLSE